MFRIVVSAPPKLITPSFRIRRVVFSLSTPLLAPRRSYCCSAQWKRIVMGVASNDILQSEPSKEANFRLCNVSGYMTELLQMEAKDPKAHVIYIPGNPGIVTFYKEFVESLYELLGGTASITAIGHISHTSKDWEKGRLFSLQEQVDHKMNFIERELQNNELPIVLVGHSIGAYISIEMFKRIPDKVVYWVGLYPFLMLNKNSSKQISIGKLAGSPALSVAVSASVAILSLFPRWATRFMTKLSLGRSWSATAVEAACSHLVKYHTMRNMLFMAKTEFEELTEAPDWNFMRDKQDIISFLFGTDDHWAPLSMHEEISRQLPDVPLTIEQEGYTHAFSCTIEGSLGIAQHIAGLLEKHILRR